MLGVFSSISPPENNNEYGYANVHLTDSATYKTQRLHRHVWCLLPLQK